VYRALFPRSTPLDYVHVNELTPAALAPYKLVIVPYPLLLPEAAAGTLKAYVEAGGALVAEARMGWNNERGYASERIPGMGLAEVMGCRETAVQVGTKGQILLRWKSTEIPGLSPGDTIPGRWYQEALEPLRADATVAAEFPDGTPAAVLSRYGKGRTLTLGSYLSAGYETSPTPTGRRFFEGLLAWAGVAETLRVDGEMEVRLLRSGASTLMFAFNHAAQPASGAIRLRLAPGEYQATDLVTARPAGITREDGWLRLDASLPAQDVWVVQLTPRGQR